MRKFSLFFVLIALITVVSCDNSGNSGTTTSDSGTDTTANQIETPEPDITYIGDILEEKGGIKLRELNNSPEFITAKLNYTAPETDKNYPAGMVKYDYSVENYELGRVTLEDMPLANSAKGQHVHLILNNEPYHAHYNASFDHEMEAGHYVALSFLSRSYHESVKTKEAFQLIQFSVGKTDKKDIDLEQPLMFYSRPKGDYKGDDTKYILLDFYLVNITLSKHGYNVKATVNGNEFLLIDWKPYLLEGLPMGENTIKLELLDKDGNLVDAPFNPVERTITLSE